MLARLAGFLYARRRAVLYLTVLGAVIAGVFGRSVAERIGLREGGPPVIATGA